MMNNEINILRTRLLNDLNSEAAGTDRASSQSAPDAPRDVADAARQFEKVFVRQLVQVMTKDLFSSGLAGEDGPNWMSSYQDNQRDILTDVLTDHLIDSGSFQLRELMLRQWQERGLTGE